MFFLYILKNKELYGDKNTNNNILILDTKDNVHEIRKIKIFQILPNRSRDLLHTFFEIVMDKLLLHVN